MDYEKSQSIEPTRLLDPDLKFSLIYASAEISPILLVSPKTRRDKRGVEKNVLIYLLKWVSPLLDLKKSSRPWH